MLLGNTGEPRGEQEGREAEEGAAKLNMTTTHPTHTHTCMQVGFRLQEIAKLLVRQACMTVKPRFHRGKVDQRRGVEAQEQVREEQEQARTASQRTAILNVQQWWMIGRLLGVGGRLLGCYCGQWVAVVGGFLGWLLGAVDGLLGGL